MTIRKEISDSELSLLIKGGDVDAYEMLFIRYYERAYKFIAIIVGSKEVAEDLAQDVFLRIWLGRERLDENRSLKNLIFVMSRNAALNYVNAKSSSGLSLESLSDDSHPDTKGTDDRAIYHDMSATLKGAISSLPQKRQQVFRMSRIDHMSNERIAKKMGISVRTVEKHIELALKEIRSTTN